MRIEGMGMVCGVGIVEHGSNRKSRTFLLWTSMLSRCYLASEQKRKPTYIGCEVSENFKNYSFFESWCKKQIGYHNEGWEIDKDILSGFNKKYSEDSCVFVPHEINKFLTIRHRFRGDLPLGVDLRSENGRFRSRINLNGISVCLGHFSNKEDAFFAYKNEKEKQAKFIAEKWKGYIDPRAYEALMQYTVEITD